MIKKIKENPLFRHIFWLTIVFFSAHWFLLIATGRWWDDWVYADKNFDYLVEVYMQSSLPLHAIINAGLWVFPDGFYRIITFFLFYIGGLFFYNILKKIDLFSKEACFWIALLYMVIPVNDARIMWICYGYSLGLFMFWLAFYLGTLWKEYTGKKRIAIRALSVYFLMISFDTESIMMLTFLMLFYFYYTDLKEEWQWKVTRENIRKIIRAIIHHVDYFLAPIVWYFGIKLLFPGYGVYGGHSYIPWTDLIKIVIYIPYNACKTIKNIYDSYIDLFLETKIFIATFIILVIYVIVTIIKKANLKKGEECKYSIAIYWKDFMMLILGIVVFLLGFFPYAIKRNSAIVNTYIDGRDTLLLGIGLSIFFYYGVHLLFRDIINRAVLIILTFLGITYFNFQYLDWQEAYYQQVQLQNAITHNDEIKRNNTFLVMYRGALISTASYQTNGNSWEATGEQTRYYMTGTKDLLALINMDETTWALNAYGMNQYDYSDKIIDGIIFVDYSDIGKKTVLREKFNELFNKPAFELWIDEISNIKYVPITEAESNYIIQLYEEGQLDDSMIYKMYY